MRSNLAQTTFKPPAALLAWLANPDDDSMFELGELTAEQEVAAERWCETFHHRGLARARVPQTAPRPVLQTNRAGRSPRRQRPRRTAAKAASSSDGPGPDPGPAVLIHFSHEDSPVALDAVAAVLARLLRKVH